ncbi:MAG: EAL domain-containing protein [Azospirillaceae bacterium]|nr:EAL domain-containing protein [Azospirillaceae bacterium]
MSPDEDELLEFLPDEQAETNSAGAVPWLVAVIDDDELIHAATRFALEGFAFQGRPIRLLSATSSEAGQTLLREQPNIACVLLDVVMGTEDAGLRLVRWIREELGNADVQIVLRTGQPGYAPELEAITHYAINDYKTKGELTRTKLLACITTALRAFRHLRTVQAARQGLEMIIEGSRDLLRRESLRKLAAGVLYQLSALLQADADGVVCFVVDVAATRLSVLAGAGRFDADVGRELGLDDVARRDPGLHQRVVAALAQRASLFLDDGAVLLFEIADGRMVIAAIHSTKALTDLDKHLIRVFAVNSALCFDNAQLLERIREMAFVDPLSGLHSRARFLELVNERVAGGLAVVLCDIDHFHAINERLGHEVGNTVLREIASRLQSHFGASRELARLDGNTFALIAETADPDRLRAFVAALRQVIAPSILVGDCVLDIGVTVAAAMAPAHGGDANTLVDRASIALRRQKQENRGDLAVYDPVHGRQVAGRLDLVHEIAQALRAGEFHIAVQPKINLETGRVSGGEALLRWRRPDGRAISPAEFIPVVEDSGLMLAVGDMVLDQACHWRVKTADLPDSFRIAVNVSVRQLVAPDYVERTLRIIHAAGCLPQQVELEITESVMVDTRGIAVANLERLRQQGITIAIDDFGTGFSSLGYLQFLPVDVLKIDRQFLANIGDSNRAYGVLSSIVSLAHNLGMVTVVEGVETTAEARLVRACGCTQMQGFVVSPAKVDCDAGDLARFNREAQRVLFDA